MLVLIRNTGSNVDKVSGNTLVCSEAQIFDLVSDTVSGMTGAPFVPTSVINGDIALPAKKRCQGDAARSNSSPAMNNQGCLNDD